MALIVEDGTGLSDAESYVSVADLTTYAGKRGLTITGGAVSEQKLREATEYVDVLRRYKASRSSVSQVRQFPRTGLTDWDGLAVTGVPSRVKDAVCYLAIVAESESLFVDLDRGGRVKSESVGPISTTYMDDAPAGKVYAVVERLLAPYFRDKYDNQPSPFYSPGNADYEPIDRPSYFTVGMTDE
jgi:hypothetical protein